MARLNRKRRKARSTGIFVIILLIFVMLAAILTGIWFLLSPRVMLDAAQAEQDALVESIMTAALAAANVEAVAEEDDSLAISVRHSGIDGLEGETIIEDSDGKAVESKEIALTKVSGFGILTIEKIGLRMPVIPGVSEEQLKIAAGWVTQTAPVGLIGNAVVAGHRQYEYGRQFNRLDELEPGDIIQYQSIEGEAVAFSVYDILVVEPDDQSVFYQPADRAILTLYTCTPIRMATHRLIVRAERVR